jgi:hypothetical protein
VSAPGDSGAFSAIGESTNSSVASDIGALNEKIDEVIGTSFARQLEKFLLSDWDGHDEAEQAGDLNLQQAGMISALLDDENVSLEDVMQALVDIQHASGVMKVNAERVKTPRSLPAQPARLVSAFMVGLQELKFRPSCEDVAGEDVIADKLWGLKYGDAYVFEDDGPRPGICASVEILLDASSSMETCIVEAATVVLNCALALERIAGVRCSVDKFPTSAGNVAVESLLAFGESPRRAQQKISSVIADGSTPMAEAIAQVRQSLMRDRGLKKVMIVVTDGVPDSKPMAQREVAICEALGILVIAIGIGDIESQINSVFKRVVIAESVRELEQGLRRVFKTHVRRHLMPA